MSQFYDNASLVVVPSGYKAGTVYAQKPLTTDGQLSFTRASGATRVASNGLIEKVRTNLVLQSNTFSTTWITTSATVTSGQAGYDGSSNAWLLSKSGAYGRVEQTLATTGLETFSVYVKAGTSNYTEITSNAGPYVGVNLTNGSIVAQSGVTALVISVGSGWYRISIAYTKAASNIWRVIAGDAGSASSAAGSTGTIVIQNAQAETGDIATDYIPTTTAAVSVGPVSNVPRLDYLNSSCPRLLLEPAATAINQFSEQLDNAYWIKENATITANSVTSPDGYTNADTLTDDTTSGRHRIYIASASFASGTSYTLSAFVKKNSSGRFLLLNAATAANARAVLNLDTLQITNINGTGKVEDYGNGWYRFSVTGTATVTQSVPIFIQMQNAATDTNYVGNGSSFYLWGINLTATGYVQSYIPTLSTSVTRVADAASKTGISSLIGQTEGTIFVEVNDAANTGTIDRVVAIGDGTGANRIIVLKNASGNIFFFVASGGSTIINQTNIAGTSLVNGNYKIAVAYKSGQYAIYLNGASVFTSTAATVPATSNYYLAVNEEGGVSAFSGKFSQALLFKTRLTNAQLAELTTL
jgi:hypothetical protein